LLNENVEFDIDTLDSYVKATYPDLRKCLNLCQSNSISGTLVLGNTKDAGTADYKLTVVELFKKKQIKEARTLLCKETAPDEMESLFRWMYDNLELWGKTPEQQDEAIKIIRKGLATVPMVSDQEINLSATIIELSQL
jgi:replication factor C small subunit